MLAHVSSIFDAFLRRSYKYATTSVTDAHVYKMNRKGDASNDWVVSYRSIEQETWRQVSSH